VAFEIPLKSLGEKWPSLGGIQIGRDSGSPLVQRTTPNGISVFTVEQEECLRPQPVVARDPN